MSAADKRATLTPAETAVVMSLAANKYLLARRLGEWGVGAPSLENAVACTAIAQEEAGHARVLYSLLEAESDEAGDLSADAAEIDAKRFALSYLSAPSRSFVRAVTSLTLADRAFTVRLGKAKSSLVEGLRKRATRILGDEGFHQRYADGRLQEFAHLPSLAEELECFLPETLCWFGGADDSGGELRGQFLASLGGALEQSGLSLETLRRIDGAWAYTEELPWNQWDAEARRMTPLMARWT